ncbi:MAG: ABC transporter permease [Candidatus Bathyarchaeota archaeon]
MTNEGNLLSVDERGWRRGFANLLRRESDKWWRTRRWQVQSLLWLLIVNGILAIGVWVVPIMEPAEAGSLIENMVIFMKLMAWFPMFSVIVIAQGAIVGEKQSGTAAWVLSAPVSRSAFILAKFIGNAVAFLVILIGLQGFVAFAQLSLSVGGVESLQPFLAGMGLLSLYLLFYLALTLMLGTFFSSSEPVLGISIAVAIGSMWELGGMFSGLVPGISLVLPESLPSLVVAVVSGETLPSVWPIPIISISLYTVLFVALAIWRFNREEF